MATVLAKSYYSHKLNITSDESLPLKYVFGAYYYWENNSAPYYVEDVDQPYFANPVGPVPVTPLNPTALERSSPIPSRRTINSTTPCTACLRRYTASWTMT